MNILKQSLIVITLTIGWFTATGAFAADPMLTEEQAIAMALEAHPGEVIKAYKETKRGEEVWEVQVKGEDGKKWETYYNMAGELVKEEAEE